MRILAVAVVVIALHVIGWTSLAILSQSVGALAVGVGVTAYVLGLRHAFDADHIAAIDNATRSMLDRRPISVGLFFSLGHSTIVFGLVMLVSLGARSLLDHSALQEFGGIVGTGVSAAFLLTIAVLNAGSLRSSIDAAHRARTGETCEPAMPAGLLTRVFGRAFRLVRRPWHMYLVGLLFGLGFDTATEIGLLALAGGVSVANVPWYAVLCLPVLFAAGMTLLDSADGIMMLQLYRWSAHVPLRRIYYTIVVTAVTVVTAAAIGLVEMATLVGDHLRALSGLAGPLSRINMEWLGVGILTVFVIIWSAFWCISRVIRPTIPAASLESATCTGPVEASTSKESG